MLESADGWCALTRTVFFPGGGGQPPDRGQLRAGAETLTVTDVREDGAGRLWHAVGRDLAAGVAVSGALDWPYRHALSAPPRVHAPREHRGRQLLGGIITGVQIGPERSRIDFRLGDFSRELIPELEARVNDVRARPRDHPPRDHGGGVPAAARARPDP